MTASDAATPDCSLNCPDTTAISTPSGSTALVPLLRRLDPGRTMDLLETHRSNARRLNAALIVAGGLALILVGR
jgi:hypothetical protein